MKSILAGIIASVVLAPALHAEPLQATLETWEVITETNEDGTLVETRIAPQSIVPQDRVEVIANLNNTGEDPLTSISFILDIDPALVIDVDSVGQGEAIQHSFATHQDPQTFDAFAALKVIAEDGTERPARPEDLGSIKVEIAEIGSAKNARFGYTATVR